jgi:flavodoxin I
MKRTGIFYGSQTGNTAAAARLIAGELGIPPSDVRDIASAGTDEVMAFDSLILGTSTWGTGELQEDWAVFLPKLGSMDLSGKPVALFGLGDQLSFCDWYLDGMGSIYDAVVAAGAEVVGSWPTDDYSHSESTAVRNGKFVGLALDADNQDHLTPVRVSAWVSAISPLLS